jgi:hypothetical protein
MLISKKSSVLLLQVHPVITHTTTATTTKASSSSSSFPITEYEKLDGSNFVAKTEMEEFEESLMAQYKSQTKG